jgi:hypothetical protein
VRLLALALLALAGAGVQEYPVPPSGDVYYASLWAAMSGQDRLVVARTEP